MQNSKFEAIGGHLFALYEPDQSGYNRTVCCIEAEIGKVPYIVELARPLTKAEINDLLRTVVEVYTIK